MIRVTIILMLLLGGKATAQVFEDDFSDGDLTSNPMWTGDVSNFVVYNLNNNHVLRLNASESSTSYLSTPSSGIIGYWEFFIWIEGSAPSGSNKAEIILVSDQSDLTGLFNGYGIRIGETGDDFFRLIRYDAGDEASIIVSNTTIFQRSGSYRVKTTRDELGNWSLEIGEGYNGELKNSGNTGFDNTYNSSSYFGVKVRNTSSRTDDFYFDFKIDESVVEEIEFDDFEQGDVLINEFLKDPPPDSGFPEYVEIVNRTEKTLNLKDWVIGDNSNLKSISESDFVLFPDTHLVLTNNPEALTTTFGEIFVHDVSLPALNNNSDQIRVYTPGGHLVDSLEYSLDWGGVDVALERRSLDVTSTFLENWSDSQNELGGTPGRVNDVSIDTDPPFVIESEFISPSVIRLIFNERVEAESAQNPLNYQTDLFEINYVEEFGNSVQLNFTSEFEDGDQVSISIWGIKDVFGNVQNKQVLQLEYVEIREAIKQNVVINEILYRRKDALSPEFIELYNPTEFNFDLSGWTFSDAVSTVELPSETILRSNEYLVITDNYEFAESITNGLYLNNFPSLNDSGDELVIRNPLEKTIDSLFYDDSWGENNPGISIERKDPLAASFDKSNWAVSTSNEGFSPGNISSVFEVDITPPEIIFSSIDGDQLLIAFTEVVSITPETKITVNNLGQSIISIPEVISSEINLRMSPSNGKVTVTSQAAEIIISNLRDYKGNISSLASNLITTSLKPGEVVINEILYNPLADDEDNLPDQTEYVELYNPTDKAISLEGIFIHDEPDEDNEIRSIYPVSTQYKWLPPDSYVLIYSDSEASEFNQSSIANYFELHDVENLEVIHMDRSSLSLASSNDAIFLADRNGVTIDSVFFDENWQNPNVFDTKGIALERIDPFGPSNDASNWSSSTHVSGGTPLSENSIFQVSGITPGGNGISFSPNPFSPDEDGSEDHLFINYRLDAPDYLLRIRIFDRYGREVRELVNNYQAGFEGSLIWDGLTDDRTNNRVGRYIVYFEAYDSASGRDRTFKETVVLARKF